MTREWYKQNKYILDEWAKGKEIEWLNESSDTWEPMGDGYLDFFAGVEYRIKPEHKFPIYAKAKNHPFYVEFSDENKGIVIGIQCGDYTPYRINTYIDSWESVFNKNTWKIIPNPYELYDKDAVWCWYDRNKTCKIAKFWDAKFRRTFFCDGGRGGDSYDHYEKILPWEEPKWVKEARKILVN